MDSGVATAVATAVGDFSTDALTQLSTIIPLAIVVMISIVLVFKSLGWFKKIAGLRTR